MAGTGCMYFNQGTFGAWFHSPNSFGAYQVCKGPRHFASALTSDWNFSWSATVDRPPVFTIWASGPECSNYDEAGRSVVDEALNAPTFISVDPRTTWRSRAAPTRRWLFPCATSLSRTTWSTGSS